ncbi:5-dehydro-4-deoxyglucarate dehydratase [Plantibacter sp. ME-Dv--P-122b]|uniref:5-dehydro-4-deoxyglucarate dehydratase n=1 Tax=Plantibacter sp. ME-Dv--P-122b TaxID=3040300 RepID=UPI00254E2CD3|nr:5-dehydro-4-deoxyglucarate dehydratase [Plantibacter sp. ME-Dv--P-122b]
MTTPLAFDGVLFFPVTPFAPDGTVDHGLLAEHLTSRLSWNPGAVFPACGTGEFHALAAEEVREVVATTVSTVAGAVPVVAGTGGPLGHAIACARSAEVSGADALLILPPYLVAGPIDGTVAYIEAILAATSLPVIVYHRGTAQYSAAAMRRLVEHPQVVGFKDGSGDVALAQEIVSAVHAAGREDFLFFNGLLTAELSQRAYRALGIPLYSSASFAMAPAIADAFYRAYRDDDQTSMERLLTGYYAPLVRLRDETPGFGVSLIKAGIRREGLPVGPVRAPLVDPSPAQLERLGSIIDAGLALVESTRTLTDA